MQPEPGDLEATFEHSRAVIGSTIVLPYLTSPTARRTRGLRVWMLTMPVDFVAFAAPAAHYLQHWKGIVVTAGVVVALFALGGLYAARRHLSLLDDLPSLVGRMLVAGALVSIVVAIRHSSAENLASYLRAVSICAGLVVLGRAVTYAWVRLARRRRWVEHSAIILGGGPVALELARLLRRYPQYGLRFTGFVDVESAAHDGLDSAPLVGGIDEVATVVRRVDCEVVIVADIDCAEERLLAAVGTAVLAGLDVWMVPRLREFAVRVSSPDHIGAIPVVRVRRSLRPGLRRYFRRLRRRPARARLAPGGAVRPAVVPVVPVVPAQRSGEAFPVAPRSSTRPGP
ncbi:hypothetical protein ABT369_11755 [Dactylosporangium sp. NPDC000244]|uniref:nucleoside-diphosphate sugar epimerase/dehydratase n=1 Tax=Dactylosporangium sp. NPDC000244 TaxID=3154365 RepID=UPI003320868F